MIPHRLFFASRPLFHRISQIINTSGLNRYFPCCTHSLQLNSRLPTFHPRVFSMTTVESAPSVVTDQSNADPKLKFRQVFDDLFETIIADIESNYDLPADAITYLRKVVSYNVPHGKLNRGLAVFQCYKAFKSDSSIPDKDEYRANILGWCVEFLQAFFLVADDIMDDSLTRRGQPCFYRLPEIGLNAINDAIILETMLYRVLRIKFGDDPVYPHLVDLFRDISYTTELGQMLDLTSQDPGVVDLDRFTEQTLTRIYRYKTSHYTFYLPVALGMRLAGVSDQKCYDTAKSICLKMGHYFQAQDDYLDAFGDPKITGKVGTDIEDNTCTWLIVQALKMVDVEQRTILEANYGRKDSLCAQRVKDVYRDLGLPNKFIDFEKESYASLRANIDAVDFMPTGAFDFLLSKIYKRDK